MAFRIEFTLLKPRIWLLAACMLWAGSFGLQYYQAQLNATKTLAMRLGLPSVVAVQDFRKMRDSNHMGEVQLTARIRMSDTRPLTSARDPQLYLIPLYATTAGSGEGDGWAPFGFYITTRDENEAGLLAYGLDEIDASDGSALVNVLGTEIRGQSALADTPYDLVPADVGLEGGAFLVAGGLVERAATLGNRSVKTFHDILFAFGCILFSMAIFSWMHGRRQFVIGRQEQRQAPVAQSARSKQAFLPLASQDDIVRSDEAERARKRRSKFTAVSAFLGDPGSAVKNPR